MEILKLIIGKRQEGKTTALLDDLIASDKHCGKDIKHVLVTYYSKDIMDTTFDSYYKYKNTTKESVLEGLNFSTETHITSLEKLHKVINRYRSIFPSGVVFYLDDMDVLPGIDFVNEMTKLVKDQTYIDEQTGTYSIVATLLKD